MSNGIISGVFMTIATVLVAQGTEMVKNGELLTGGAMITAGGVLYIIAYYLQMHGLKKWLKK